MFWFGRFSRPVAALVALLAVGLSTAVYAGEHVNTDKTGLAINGYDPVAYFEQHKPVQGDFQITAEHDGAVYRFASESNRDLFTADPGKYVPQYGGYCAFGVALGKKFSADPNVWKIVDGKLYLNLNPAIAEKFNEGLNEHLVSAEKHWPAIKDVPAQQIE